MLAHLVIKRLLSTRRLVYVCGLGSTGALGLPQYYKPYCDDPDTLQLEDIGTPNFRRLKQIDSRNDKIEDIACGYGYTIIAAQVSGSSQTALGFGLNSFSQIGYHAPRPGYALEIVATPSPIWTPSTTPIVRVSCGRSHSLLLNKSGQVYSLGNNSLGQCGRPINEKEEYFGSKRVTHIREVPSDIIDIECGQDHSMFLSSSGELYSCGWGADGQTGLGHYDTQPVPTLITGDIKGVKIIKVSSSADTVLALDEQGNVYGWGNSEYAQFKVLTQRDSVQFSTPKHLNMSDVPGRIIDIASGGTMCAVLNDKGHVYVWGYGILGKGPQVDHSSLPTQIPETLFGANVLNTGVKVVKIDAGLSQFAAINSQGDMFAWGKNRGRLLGLHHGKDQMFPRQVDMNLASVKKISLGIDHACALVEKIC